MGTRVRIVGDASPWGLGAYLLVDGSVASWYSCPLTPQDGEVLRTPVGSSSGQQVWEALNRLVALRLWASRWHSHRVTLEVRADNVTALTMVATMRGRGWAVNTIAREVALDFAQAAFRPAVCAHVAGVSLSIADALSRRDQPTSGSSSSLSLPSAAPGWQLPTELSPAAEAHPPPRPATWHRALCPV